jgi:hypothetical protein
MLFLMHLVLVATEKMWDLGPEHTSVMRGEHRFSLSVPVRAYRLFIEVLLRLLWFVSSFFVNALITWRQHLYKMVAG